MAKIKPNEECPCGSGLLFKECHGPKVKRPKEPDIEARIPLKIIPEPDPGTRSVFINTGEGTKIIQGNETNIALICGNCEAELIAGLHRDQIRGVVLKCNNCGSFNET